MPRERDEIFASTLCSSGKQQARPFTIFKVNDAARIPPTT